MSPSEGSARPMTFRHFLDLWVLVVSLQTSFQKRYFGTKTLQFFTSKSRRSTSASSFFGMPGRAASWAVPVSGCKYRADNIGLLLASTSGKFIDQVAWRSRPVRAVCRSLWQDQGYGPFVAHSAGSHERLRQRLGTGDVCGMPGWSCFKHVWVEMLQRNHGILRT